MMILESGKRAGKPYCQGGAGAGVKSRISCQYPVVDSVKCGVDITCGEIDQLLSGVE